MSLKMVCVDSILSVTLTLSARTEAIDQEQAIERAQCIVETFEGLKVGLLIWHVYHRLS